VNTAYIVKGFADKAEAFAWRCANPG